MKTIVLSNRSKDHELKILVPGGIVLIKIGLHDGRGNDCTYVSVSADGNRYAGDPQWWVATNEQDEIVGTRNGIGLRIVKQEA